MNEMNLMNGTEKARLNDAGIALALINLIWLLAQFLLFVVGIADSFLNWNQQSTNKQEWQQSISLPSEIEH